MMPLMSLTSNDVHQSVELHDSGGFFVSNRDHDSELNKIICDIILISAVYLNMFNYFE